jgi:hypothetical protein
MTDDLVKRLRDYADYRATADDLSSCLFKAADRIEQLEAALREIADGAVADNADDACHVLMKMARAALGEKKDGNV